MKFLKPLTGIVAFAASTMVTSPAEGIEVSSTSFGLIPSNSLSQGECIRLGLDWDGKTSSFGLFRLRVCNSHFLPFVSVDVFSAANTTVTRKTGYSLLLVMQQAGSGPTTHGMTDLEHLNAHRPAKCLLTARYS
ncbi:hypothetical protein A7U60_g942 [Sanghuangporus baumii]|uniref:Uncharacterized protein n=1 Tax=Sanghuangporus baumii TaxID=108892 RepID=A0A9Q5I518_SANBA|nr:hypothetical protein A7U60_g942 [Sanghuangporus baumii]